MEKSSIHLKAYHCHDGREIHYAAARLHRDPSSPTIILDADDPHHSSSKIGACFVFFYPMGPNRRLLEAVVSQYAQKFECDKDVLFLCVNRPGKGGTSSSNSVASTTRTLQHEETTASDEKQHVLASMNDIITILDYHAIRKASLLYMCAGSTFAYSFASKFPERTTGYIIGIASWVLRSGSTSSSSSCYSCSSNENGEFQPQQELCNIETPQMHSLTHRMAMKGFFGPKWIVSTIVGGFVGSASTVFSSVPPAWIGKSLKKDLSEEEVLKFNEQFPEDGTFVEMMKWIHNDGCDEEVSIFVNDKEDSSGNEETNAVGNKKEGDAKDVAVCLSTQQDLGLIYKTTIPPQRQVLLWHGEADKMISVAGADYLESMIQNATLTRIPGGTHQGVMFFLPDDVMEALNRISRDVSV